MQENYLRCLASESKRFAKKKGIFDILLYGSIVKGKINAEDIDILLIFDSENLKKRTELAHEFKEIIKDKKKVDIKTINLKELFESDFLARQGILIEGYSLLFNEDFSRRIGFVGKSIFSYTLKKLNHNEKTKFTYALIGRRNEPGILKRTESVPIGRGAIKSPIKNSLIFEEFLQRWKINYTKKNILEEI